MMPVQFRWVPVVRQVSEWVFLRGSREFLGDRSLRFPTLGFFLEDD